MNPKDYFDKGLPMEAFDPEPEPQPESEPKTTPKFKEGDFLFGNEGEGKTEFAGRVRDITDWGNELQYVLVRNESDYHDGERQWFHEKDLNRLSLLDRVRRLEHFLEIDE